MWDGKPRHDPYPLARYPQVSYFVRSNALALYNTVPLDLPPGTKYEYSNAGYQLLGYVIERVSGQSYASFT